MDPRQVGLGAFRRNDLSAAISAWESLAQDQQVREALAEAYFRRGASAQSGPGVIRDLERSAQLSPADPRPVYHLGLAYHRQGELGPALAAYAKAAELGFPRRHALAFAKALAGLEHDPLPGLVDLEGLEPEVLAALRPVTALLENKPQVVEGPPAASSGQIRGLPSTPMALALWRGLGELAAGNPDRARQTLDAIAPMSLPDAAEALRVLHLGHVHVRLGHAETAHKLWAAAYNRLRTPALAGAMAGRLLTEIRAALESGRLQEAVDLAAKGLKASPGLSVLRTASAVAHHRLARAAEARRAWEESEHHWLAALDMPESKASAPMLSATHQNLALVYEMQLDWALATQHWQAFQAYLPKREGRAIQPGPTLAERRLWLHRRIAKDSMKAGLPDEAVTALKKALKVAPEDLELRMGLAETLVELDRIPLAHKEIDTILRIDPKHVEARLLRASILREESEDRAAERVLRQILAMDSSCGQARTALADLLTDCGNEALAQNRLAVAHRHLAEARSLDPDNLDALAYLAATEKMMGDPFAYQASLDLLLECGTELAYIKAFELHCRCQDLGSAKGIVAKAEQEGKDTSNFRLMIANLCQWAVHAIKDGSGTHKRKARAEATAREGWIAFAGELLRGIKPAELELNLFIDCIERWILVDPEVAVTYARLLVKGHPDSFPHLFLLAHAQAGNGEVGAALGSLRKAEKLARKEGDSTAVKSLRQMIDILSSPLADLSLNDHLNDGIPF